MDERETSLSLARARLYTFCLKERPVLVVSVGLEPSLDDLPADDAPLLLTELYARTVRRDRGQPEDPQAVGWRPGHTARPQADRRRSRSLVCLVSGQRERNTPDLQR